MKTRATIAVLLAFPVLAPSIAIAGELEFSVDGLVGIQTSSLERPDYGSMYPRFPGIPLTTIGGIGATVRNDFGPGFFGASVAARFGESSTERSRSWGGYLGDQAPAGFDGGHFSSESFAQKNLAQMDLHYGVKAGDFNVVFGGGVTVDRYTVRAITDERNMVLQAYTWSGPPAEQGLIVGSQDAYSDISLDSVRVSPMIFTSIERRITNRINLSLRGQISMPNGTIHAEESGSWKPDTYVLENGTYVPSEGHGSLQSFRNNVSADLQPQGSLMLGLSFRLN